MSVIPLTPVQRAAATHHDAPYRAFIASSLTLGVGGGFLLGLILSLARAAEWGWGSGARYPALVQAHGQLQLIGFVGLFVMAMVLRLSPRIAGRRLAFGWAAPWLLASVSLSLVLRVLAEPSPVSGIRDVALGASAALFMAGAAAFAAIVAGTHAGRGAQASATSVFFLLGAAGYAAAASLNVLQVSAIVQDGLSSAPSSKQVSLVFAEQYGFALMFIGGVASRAVPTFTGHRRRDPIAVATAVILAAGVACFVLGSLWAAYRGVSQSAIRSQDAGLILTAVSFILLAMASGALEPGPNRVAAASQTQFWFVRAAMAWLVVAAALTLWYAIPAFADATSVDQFQMDAIRHTLTLGVLTMLIIGMAMLILPEFAGRRLQHPDERWLVIGLLVALNVAVVLRIWPATEGVNWLAHTRYWPMAIGGVLAETVVGVFGLMFAQSYFEQRHQGWGRPKTLAGRRSTAPPQ